MSFLLRKSELFTNQNVAIKVLNRCPQVDYDLHSHEFSELVICYDGRGEHFRKDVSNIVSTGDVFVIHGHMEHGYRKIENLCLYNIVFNMDDFSNSLLELARFPAFHALFMLEPHFRQNESGGAMHLNSKELENVITIIRQMEIEEKDREQGFNMMITALFMQLVALLSRYYDKRFGDISRELGTIRLSKVLAAISADCKKDWSRDEMAALADMSISTLTRCFKRFTDCSPFEYLLRCRIQKACALLSLPDKTISGIAQECGFNDSNYFSRQFVKHTGLNPRDFRKLHSVQIKF